MHPSQSGLGAVGGMNSGIMASWWLTGCSLLAGELAVLVVGLGGGSLPLFVHDYFSQAHVAVVEIDPSMVEVATRWFGFSQGERMRVHVCDGLDYVAKLAAEGTSQGVSGAPLNPGGCHAG